MTTVVSRELPHGSVGCETVGNPNVKGVCMKLNDNIMSLKKEIASLQRAVLEIQRR